jgi:membrane protein DedA with SNARE-associated domain
MEHFLTHYGYLALIIFAFVEACCIPISSEITFAAAGALAAQGHLSLALIIVIGTLAEMGGSMTSYAVGRRGGRQLLDRYGKWVLVSHSDLDRAERFFANRGSWAVAVARVLPLIRCFASFGAGVVEVPVAPFAIFSLIGTAVWATVLSLLGYEIGSKMTNLFHSFSLIGAALLVLFVLGLVLHRVQGARSDARRAERLAAAPAASADPSAPADPAAPGAPAPGRPAGAHRANRDTTSTGS